MNGQLAPELRKPGSKIENLTANHIQYKDAWLGTDNAYTNAYKDLKDLCAKAEEDDYKWHTLIQPKDLPESWVSGHAPVRDRYAH